MTKTKKKNRPSKAKRKKTKPNAGLKLIEDTIEGLKASIKRQEVWLKNHEERVDDSRKMLVQTRLEVVELQDARKRLTRRHPSDSTQS